MKMQYLNPKRLALAAALLLGVCGASAQEPFSPAGTWDLVISGAEKGVAYITFDDEGGLSGFEVLVPSKPGEPESERNDGSTAGRVTTPGPTEGTTVDRLFGFASITGTWTYDINGRVIGVYTEGSDNKSCSTNLEITTVVSNAIIDYKTNIVTITVTNFFTNEVTICVTNPVTNGVSFMAVVKPDRISIKTTGTNGNTTLKGIPAMELPDLSGPYYAQARKEGLPEYNEFLTLIPVLDVPGLYEVTGQGAGYEYTGKAVVSGKKKMGLVIFGDLTSGVGSVNFDKGKANLDTFDFAGLRGKHKLTRQTQ
jgi:hypothetical protein